MTFRRSISLILLAEVLIAWLAANNYGITVEGLQAVTRFSGRLSLVLFSIIFTLLPRNRGHLHLILSEKVILVFAVAHGIHLIELLSYVYLSNAELIPVRLAGGFLAYVLIFTLPVLQHFYESGKLNENKYLFAETLYLYYVWFIFFMSYLPRVQGKLPNVGGTYQEFVVLLAWVCILLGMKLSVVITRMAKLRLKN